MSPRHPTPPDDESIAQAINKALKSPPDIPPLRCFRVVYFDAAANANIERLVLAHTISVPGDAMAIFYEYTVVPDGIGQFMRLAVRNWLSIEDVPVAPSSQHPH